MVESAVVVIPVYNHGAAVGAVAHAARGHGLSVLLVDDGSSADCAAVLDALAARDAGVQVVRLSPNQGKGAAMMVGLRAASERGFTHALQIDADGQHDAAQIPQFLQMSRGHPQAVICGTPVYDQNVPRARLYGRYLTHVWVWINTLSGAIRDSMCGFRVYPLASTLQVIDAGGLGKRMDFDPALLVRLHWRGVAIVNVPTQVRYPQDGVSHFHYLRDNWLISKMHTRLFFGMLARLPMLLWRKVKHP